MPIANKRISPIHLWTSVAGPIPLELIFINDDPLPDISRLGASKILVREFLSEE